MKTQKIIYWLITGLLAAGMLMSAFMYLTRSPEIVGGFKRLGFPEYFIVILGTAKLLGAIALVAPVGNRVKEWAYAGFMFTFVGAICTHLATSTPWVSPAVFLVLLGSSYVMWLRVKSGAVRESVGRVQHAA